jgi:Meiotically up-regulated gene 113
MIYFIQPIDGGPIKIGYAKDIAARVKQLEVENGKKMSLLASIPGGKNEERQLHSQFSHLRFAGTEQFRPAPDLMALILGKAPNAHPIEGRTGKKLKLTDGVFHRLQQTAILRRTTYSELANSILDSALPYIQVIEHKGPPK